MFKIFNISKFKAHFIFIIWLKIQFVRSQLIKNLYFMNSKEILFLDCNFIHAL